MDLLDKARLNARDDVKCEACFFLTLKMKSEFMFEVNPVTQKIEELSQRTDMLRGYL